QAVTSRASGRGAAGDGRQHDDDVVVGQLGVKTAAEPDVLVVDVDVDEATQAGLLDQAPLQSGVPGVDVVDQLRQGAAATGDALLAAGVRPQNRRDLDFDRHAF